MTENRATLEEGQVIERMTCEGIGSKGDGIFRQDGMVIFVKDTIVNKEYNILITKVLSTVAFGEVTQ